MGVRGLIATAVSQVLDKVQVQLQTIMDDALCREGIPTPNPSPTPGGDEHALSLQLVRMFARVGPNAEPKFRDDCECMRACARCEVLLQPFLPITSGRAGSNGIKVSKHHAVSVSIGIQSTEVSTDDRVVNF